MSALPERINAISCISYDVKSIVDILADENDVKPSEITLEMVMERVESWVGEDYATDGGEIIFQDENGEEIEV